MPDTLIELLRERACRAPDRVAYRHASGGEEVESLTYARVERRALAVAARLRRCAEPGDRALLLYPPGLDYLGAFLGCLAAGVVAVPVFPPRTSRLERTLGVTAAIAADCQPRVALTTGELAAALAARADEASGLAGTRWLATDDVDEWPADWRGTHARPDDLAFLQYTSGSTSAPKGVELTHANLLHNQRMIAFGGDLVEDDVHVNWVPLHHDMGLAVALLPISTGAPYVLLSPAEFVQWPHRWLEAISRYRGTVGGGPDFGYALCNRRVTAEQRAALDLSSWRGAFDGAEPIRVETLERFAELFAPAGFRAASFHPIYGLAEATSYVSMKRPGTPTAVLRLDTGALGEGRIVEAAGDDGARPVVGCGPTCLGTEVLVVDPETLAPAAPDRVGELWVAGGAVGRGYWNNPIETAATFGGRLASGEGPYLRTGDLGFVRGGEVFVVGRSKDLLILNGVNHYPQDLELTAERAHPAIRPGGCAAFAIEEGGGERAALVVEIERTARRTDAQEIVDAVRRAIAEEHQVLAGTVALVRPGAIPRTTSGKVQRRLCRARLLAGELAGY